MGGMRTILPLQGVDSLVYISSLWFNDMFSLYLSSLLLSFVLQEGAFWTKIWTQK